MNPRWKQRPEGSTWGDFGPDDQLGRLNLLTPERVMRAASEIKTGQTFCLSLPLDLPGGNVLNARRHPPKLEPTQSPDGTPRFNFAMRMENPAYVDVGCDDRVLLTLQYSTQWDGFSHMGQYFDADGDGEPEIRYYNGYRGGTDVIGPAEYRGAQKLGIDTFAEKGLVGRGVMLDLHRHFGRERKIVGYDDFMMALEKNKVTVETGDMLCLYTGFADVIIELDRKPDGPTLARACATLNGRDDRLLQWISDSGIAALIADNYAVEQSPALPGKGERYANSPLHQHCLFKLGVPLGEIWFLTDLNRWLEQNGRTRFFMTAQPLRLPGAVGSPANAVGIV
ncbi:MAG: cyclase family protein [Alphaproteobacteria bacterium]|nr:cyclase family protein [Alphaproteobacteria bacterium]